MNVRGWLLVALLAAVPVGPAIARAPERMTAPASTPVFYTIPRYAADHLTLGVWLNDVPVLHTDEDDLSAQGAHDSLNAWIMPGRNRLMVRLERPKAPGFRADHMHARLTVEALTRGQSPGAGRCLVDFKTGDQPGVVTVPVIRTFEFDVPAPPPGTFWAQAKPLTLDKPTTEAARTLTRIVRSAISREDVATLVKHFTYRETDVARANHQAPPDMKTFVERQLIDKKRAPLETVDYDKLRFQLVAGGRLIHVLGPDGQEALRSAKTAKSRVTIPLYLGRVNGQLVIAR